MTKQTSGETTTKVTEAKNSKRNVTDLSIMSRKQRELRGATLVESAAAPTSDKARLLLQKMGWTEGTGLGKRRDGISTHLKAKRRKEQSGLGIEKQVAEHQAATEHWWKDSLGDTLARIGTNKKKKRTKKIFTDEELFEATGGARFGMRAAPTKNLAKWRRTESGSDDDDDKKKKTGRDEGSADANIESTATVSAATVGKKEKKAKRKDRPEGGEDERLRKKAKKDKKEKKAKDMKEKKDKKKAKLDSE